MTVVVLRHAHAEPPDGGRTDLQRPLSARGRVQAAALRDHLAPVLAGRAVVARWSSPAVRCQATLADLADPEVPVETDQALSEDAPLDLARRVLTRATHVADERGGVVVCATHAPVLGSLALGWHEAGRLAERDLAWPTAGGFVLAGATVRPLPPPPA